MLRMILRRATRFGKIIGFDAPFLAGVADAAIEEMGGHYTDLPAPSVITSCTDHHGRGRGVFTGRSNGLRILDELMERMEAEGRTVISGQEAFHLWDTYGFPVDLTRDVARDNGLTVDEESFRTTLAEAKDRSHATTVEKVGQDVSVYAEVLQQLKDKGVVERDGVRYRIYDLGGDRNHGRRSVRQQPARQTGKRRRRGRGRAPRDDFLCRTGGQVEQTRAKSTTSPRGWMCRLGRLRSPACAACAWADRARRKGDERHGLGRRRCRSVN